MSQHSHTNKMIPPLTNNVSCFRTRPRPGLLRVLCTFKLLYLPQDSERHFENFLVQKCRDELLPRRIPVCATMQLPEVKLKVTVQSVGKQSSPGCRGWLQPLLYRLGKGKSWNIPGSCCSALMHTSSELQAEMHARQQAWGRKLQPKESPALQGNFSHLIGNNPLKVGNFHLNNVFIFSLFTPLPSRGDFPGIQWSEAPWMCQAHLLWQSLSERASLLFLMGSGSSGQTTVVTKKYMHAYFLSNHSQEKCQEQIKTSLTIPELPDETKILVSPKAAVVAKQLLALSDTKN